MDALIQFPNFTNKELDYLACQIAERLKEKREYLSEREAFDRFGAGNVRRWVADRMIEPHKRPRKTEYEAKRLYELAARRQDYHRMTI